IEEEKDRKEGRQGDNSMPAPGLTRNGPVPKTREESFNVPKTASPPLAGGPPKGHQLYNEKNGSFIPLSRLGPLVSTWGQCGATDDQSGHNDDRRAWTMAL
ncbi:hypothetical protein BaRGS_00037559, partial [Batillaria attramentaria]